jgi:hypothetical protein
MACEGQMIGGGSDLDNLAQVWHRMLMLMERNCVEEPNLFSGVPSQTKVPARHHLEHGRLHFKFNFNDFVCVKVEHDNRAVGINEYHTVKVRGESE